MRRRWEPRRPVFFFAALGLVLAWLGLDLLLRRTMLPSELQYIPSDYTAVIATGSPRRLWTAVDEQFGNLIRTDPYKGALYTAIRSARNDYAEKKIKVTSPDDLEAFGIDASRGAIVAAYPSDRSLMVLGATNVQRLLDTIAKGESAKNGAVERPNGVRKIGKQFVANPTGRLVIISQDEGLLNTAVAGARGNRVHAFGADAIFEPVARQLRIPMLTGASLFVSVADPSYPMVRRVSAAVSLDRTITVDASLDFDMAPFRVVEAFVSNPPPLRAWAEELKASTAAAVMFRDWAIPQYLDALTRAGILARIEEQYAGVLGELRNLPSLRQLTIAATGYHGGLPDLLLGIWADPAAVDAMITRIQSRVRVRRDQAILRAALASGRHPADEPDALFSRYPIANGSVGPATLTAADFANAAYHRQIDGATIRFLLPPITPNDIEFRPELGDVAAQPELTSDRYRLAVTRLGDVFWFATDATVLEERVRRGRDAPTLGTTALFDATRQWWTPRDRLRLFMNLDRVIEAGLLSPEAGVSDKIRKYLMDLREHPVVSLTLTSSDRPPRARVMLHLARRP